MRGGIGQPGQRILNVKMWWGRINKSFVSAFPKSTKEIFDV
jgi:hypothetical protein